ncbi:MAG TPA: C4-type zinc ribbon domain-containing protein [Nitrospiria bacterium]|nr:C4-type zinc ribbon domain-containing protein [Nitrospiria bacterium]
MNEQLALLIRLQELDSQIDALAEQRRQAPALVEAAAKPVQEAEAELVKTKAAFDVLTRDRRDKEQELKEREDRIEKLKGRSGDIKSNKEYQAHLFEIELAQQEKGTVEERLLEMMDRIEAMQATVKSQEAAVAVCKREFDKERARLEGEQRAAQAEADRLVADAKSLAEQLAPANRQAYERLKTTRKGLAVVAVKNGACQGCRLALPPQLIADLRKNEKLLTCTYCHRMLFWPVSDLAAQKT